MTGFQNHTTLQSYLDANGVLQWGTDADIAKAKKQWRKLYQSQYHQRRKDSHPKLSLSLTRDEKERFQHLAQAHQMSLPQFVKRAALSYLDQTFLVPNLDEVSRIEQLLRLWYTHNQRLLSSGADPYTIKLMQQRLTQLETLVEKTLRHPQPFSPTQYDH